MKKRNEIHDDAPLCRERYVVAKGFIPCDGCGEEKTIAKGTRTRYRGRGGRHKTKATSEGAK